MIDIDYKFLDNSDGQKEYTPQTTGNDIFIFKKSMESDSSYTLVDVVKALFDRAIVDGYVDNYTIPETTEEELLEATEYLKKSDEAFYEQYKDRHGTAIVSVDFDVIYFEDRSEDTFTFEVTAVKADTLTQIWKILDKDYWHLYAKKAASTGSIYIPFDDENESGYKDIRISDHDANIPNKRNNPHYEIDISKIEDVEDFLSELEDAVRENKPELLEDYKYEFNSA